MSDTQRQALGAAAAEAAQHGDLAQSRAPGGRMKLLLYGINFAPEMTGIGKYTGEMAQWLAAQGHEVRVVTAREDVVAARAVSLAQIREVGPPAAVRRSAQPAATG